MANPDTDKMRSIIIMTKDDDSIIELLGKVPGWQIQENKVSSSVEYKYSMTDGSITVMLNSLAKNIVTTVNVLPHDLNNDQEAANAALVKLSTALDGATIRNRITASEADLKSS